VLRPAGEGDLTLRVDPGSYDVRWHDVDARVDAGGDRVTAGEALEITLRAPFSPDANVVVQLTAT
jgi:hypothetical protein